MFDLGWSELLLIAVIALVVVGPRDLPRMMRTAGQYMAKAREVEDLRREVASLKSEATAPLSEMRKDLDKAMQPPSSAADKQAGSAAIPETQLDGLPEEMADQIRETQELEQSGDGEDGADEKPASKAPKGDV